MATWLRHIGNGSGATSRGKSGNFTVGHLSFTCFNCFTPLRVSRRPTRIMPPRPLTKGCRAGVSAGAFGPLYKLKKLSERVLQSPGDVSLSLSEIEGATDEASDWSRKADIGDGDTAGLWASVGEGGLVALHALYALVLRRSCSKQYSETERAAYAALRYKLTYELSTLALDVAVHMTAGRAWAVMHSALRTHVLRCMAVVLADAASPLSPSQQQSTRPSKRSLTNASDALGEVRQLLRCISELLTSHEQGFDDTVSMDDFLATLAQELDASQLLEHWSRLLLLLVAAAPGNRSDYTVSQLHMVAEPLLNLLDFLGTVWQHKMLLASPSLSYLLSSHVVGLCTALDGGPTYGMQAANEDGEPALPAPAVAPVFDPTGRQLHRNGSPEVADTKLAQWALVVWSAAIGMERTLESRDCDDMMRDHGGGDKLAARPALATTMSLRPLYRWKQHCADVVIGGLQPPAASSSAPSSAQACGGAGSTSDGSTTPPAEPASPRDDPGRHSLSDASTLLRMSERRKQAQERMQLSGAPPLHTGATFEICMRLVAAATKAIASARGRMAHGSAAAADAAAPASSAPTNREQGLRLAADEAPRLLLQALRCGRLALGEDVIAAEALPPALEARLQRWWAALGEFVRVVVGRGVVSWRYLKELLPVVAPDGVHDLPSRPTPCVAAALGAGYTHHLTFILLEASRVEEFAWVDLLRPLDTMQWAWDQLLTFGPPKETRMLVTAIAGLLRRLAAAVPELLSPEGPAVAVDVTMIHKTLTGLRTAQEVYLNSVHTWLVSLRVEAKTVEGGDVAAGADGGGAASDHHGCLARQAEMLVCIARYLLPDFVTVLLRRSIPAMAAANFGTYRLQCLQIMRPLFRWLVMLAAAQTHASEQAALPGSSSQAAAAAAVWRNLLVVGMRLPELLGTAAGLVAAGLVPGENEVEWDGFPEAFSWMLSCMVQLVPGELAAALASKGAEQAAERAFRLGEADTRKCAAAGGWEEQPQEPSSSVLRLGMVRLLGPGGLCPREDLLRVLLRVLSGDGGLGEASTLKAANLEKLMSFARLMVEAA